MAAGLTGGRARHLADWYPEGWAPYHGYTRALALELLYVITLHDWPDLVPDPARLAALTAAGDPAPVDAAFAGFDRHARLLTDDGLHPPTGELAGQATSILQQQAASTSWRERENAQRVLGQLGRAMTPYDHDDDGRPRVTGISMPGALATLDAMLCSSQGGFPPATVVSYRDRGARVLAEVQRCVWAPAGGPPPATPWPGPGQPRRRRRHPPGGDRSRLGGGAAAGDDGALAGFSAARDKDGRNYIMTDPDETARLVDQITGAYREHEAGAAAVPGRVLGADVEGQADAMADEAERLAGELAALGREPRRSLDAIAVFRGLSRSAESMAAAAAELRRQEWFDLDDQADPEASAAWTGALEGLRSASTTFEWVADGWI